MDKFVGKRLDGRYEIKEIIGVGGMAVVYKAYDNIEDRIVAVKILKEEFSSNEEFLRRFKNESKAIAVLSHPNIVKVFDVSFGDLLQYIVMEYIDGITLKEYIHQQGTLRWKDAVHFTIQILKALQHAHDKGIVHRDVKPQNIMLLPDGKIKVTDFGIARFARNEHQTMTDKAIGSVHYISPEQARGEMTDEKADLYSVGVILYEMLTGRLPFQADSAVSVAIMQLQSEPELPRDINNTIPLGLEQITMHAMQKDAQKRYKTAAEMLCDLEDFKRDPEILFDYSYFVDDAPTKFVEDEQAEEESDEPPKSPVLPILAGVASAFVVALIVLGIIFVPKLFAGTSASFECPNFIGMPYNDLIANPEYKDLQFEVSSLNSAEYEIGVIMDQTPKEGKMIKKTQTIKIVVSMGEKLVTVPDVYNYDVATAVSQLKAAGFVVEEVQKPDEDVAKDRVIYTVPACNQNVSAGTVIQVYVSMGAQVVYVDVPDVTNMNEAAAKKQIEKSGLTVGTITPVNSNLPEGYVVKQDPDPKSTAQAAKGSAVNLEISNGVPSYTYKVEVPFEKDIVNKELKLVAYLDGVKFHESAGTLFNVVGKYSFEITNTTKEKATVSIHLVETQGDQPKTYSYMNIEVDFVAGKQTNGIIGEYPKAGEAVTSPTTESSSEVH